MNKTKGRNNRDRIIEAANRLFYEQGYNRTSFADIAMAADVPKGNFYYYFRTKEALLEAVVEDRLTRLELQLQGWEDQFSDPRQRLLRCVRMILEDSGKIVRFGCPTGTLNMELVKQQPELQARTATIFDMLLDWITSQIGQLQSPAKPRQMARRILSRMQGASLVAAATHDSGYLDDEAAELAAMLEAL